MKIAIVTGASSGLGKEFIHQISKKEKVDEIWAIARRKDKLQELASIIKMPVRPIALDLKKDESFLELETMLEAEKPDIRLLVNDAGFGRMGNYAEITSADNDGMIDLNCKALVRMTVLCLPHINRGGRVIEVCSSSSFQPLPGLNVYAASKAFVLRYSRALWWEVIGRGIHVTAACPYWIKDTEFISTVKKSENSFAVRHFPLASKPHSVVYLALLGSRFNLQVVSCGPVSFFQRICSKFIPHIVVDAAWEGIRRI